MKWPYDSAVREERLSCCEEAVLHSPLDPHVCELKLSPLNQLLTCVHPPLIVLPAVDEDVMHISRHLASKTAQVTTPFPPFVENMLRRQLAGPSI